MKVCSRMINKVIYVVGGADTPLKNNRLNIIRERNSTNLVIFVMNNLERTHFTHDGRVGIIF